MSDQTPANDAKPPVDAAATTALVPLSSASCGSKPKRRCGRFLGLALVAVIVVFALAGGWAYQQWQAVTTQWSAALAQNRAELAAAQAQAQRALDAAAAQTANVARLQADQTRLAQQVQDLEHTLDGLTPRAGDAAPVVLLGEVDSLVDRAQQSLRLGGKVSAALLALESARARLQQDQALPELQTALQTDIERLRALPAVDVAGLSARLDSLSSLLAQAPLRESVDEPAPDAAPAATVDDAPAPPADAPWWQTAWQQTRLWARAAWRAVVQDVRGLIQVRRIDDTAVILLAPDQAAWLRQALQTRVAAARLALLQGEPTLWIAELTAIEQGLTTHFDAHAAQVTEAQALARALQAAPIQVEHPSLDASARALASLREPGSRPQETPAAVPDTPAASPSLPAPQTTAPAPAAPPAAPATPQGAPESERG